MASTPVDIASGLLQRANAADTATNLSAQAHARNVLFEVQEQPENFPSFDADLDERVSALAYTFLHAGCTLAESGNREAGAEALTRGATLLQYCFASRKLSDPVHSFQVLVGALAFYAAGQYSRAFVVIRSAAPQTAAARLTAAFLRKQFESVIAELNSVLLNPEFADGNLATTDDCAKTTIDRVLTVFLAKGLANCTEFVFSGQPTLVEQGRTWFKDGAEVARESEDVAWWWLFRLLDLLADDLSIASPWNAIPPLCPHSSGASLSGYLQLLPFLKPPVSELWISQRQALPISLQESSKGAAISLRTSGGKTRVAEIAIMAELAKDPFAKMLYIAPFRSLAVEIERSFRRVFEPLGFNVSHLYGGSRVGGLDSDLLNEASIIIATPEKLRAILRCSTDSGLRVKLVIVDEGHLLGLDERFVRNELFFDHLRALCRRNNARMLLLSAMLPNVSEIGQWISGNQESVGQSSWKPSGERFGLLLWNRKRVKLEWRGKYQSFNPSFVVTSESRAPRRRPFPSNKQEAIAATAVRLSEIGPVLIFAGLAVSVPGYAEAVIYALGENPPAYQWPSHEWSVFEASCDEYYGVDSLELKAAALGVMCHHARLPGEVRLAMERLMAAMPPKVVIATTTLAQGVNFGFTSVIMANVWINKKTLSVRDFWNIAGRAGRAFVDTEGKVLFAIDETEKRWQVQRNLALAQKYFNYANIEPVQSGLFKLVLLIKNIAVTAGIPFETLLEMAAENDFHGTDPGKKIETLFDLVDDELLALYEELLSAQKEDPAATVDDLLRTSLAAIQAGRKNSPMTPDEIVNLLQARLQSALKQFNTPEEVRTVVSSGFPLRASVVLKEQIESIALLVSDYVAANRSEEALVTVVTFFEELSQKLANVCKNVPTTEQRDLVRGDWLNGVPLTRIIEKSEDAVEITTDFYGYGLPWILHAAGQQLRCRGNSDAADELDKIGLLVELGLPSTAAAKVFLCGIRSRCAATQIASCLRNVDSTSI